MTGDPVPRPSLASPSLQLLITEADSLPETHSVISNQALIALGWNVIYLRSDLRPF